MELIQTFKKSYFLKMSNDKHLIAQVNSSQINIFENETYKHLAQFKEVGNASVFFSNDSNLLLAKDNDRKLVVYDLATMSIRCKLKPKVGSSNGDGDACISHDNKYIINLGYDFPYGYISVYDIENGKETRFREDMREVYNQIRYIPSRQLYFIDGFRRPNEGTSEKNRYFYLWFDMDNRTFEQTFCDLDDANFLYSRHWSPRLRHTRRHCLSGYAARKRNRRTPDQNALCIRCATRSCPTGSNGSTLARRHRPECPRRVFPDSAPENQFAPRHAPCRPDRFCRCRISRSPR